MSSGESSYLRFLEGDKEGLVEIVEEYKDGLIMFISSFVGDYHIAEEAADETFLKLYVKKPKFRQGYSFRTWLYTIGRNTALDYLRKQKRRQTAPIEDYCYVTDEVDIEAEYIKTEEAQQLHRAIRQLKSDYAQVLYLVFFEELTNTETARIMGKSSRQVSDLIYRAKQALRAELGKEDGNEHLQEKR